MLFTNDHNLPETLIRAAHKRNSLYASHADRSATQLINPPQIDILRKAHFREMQKDISEEFFGLFGSAIHQVLEWGGEGEGRTEERLYLRVNGWVISGQIDLQKSERGVHIIDYKFCSAYALTKDADGKPEWEQQLNIYAYLLWINKGIRVVDLAVCAIVRDWSRAQSVVDLTYPQSIITMVPVRLWTVEEQEAYIKARVAVHQGAQFAYDIGEALPECSHSERWASPDKWSVLAEGNKRGKNFDSEAKAQEYAATLKKASTITIKHGRSIRCGYCQVSQWCEQFQKLNQQETDDADEGVG